MNDYRKAKKWMDMDATDFIGGVAEQDIQQAMEALSVPLPESYQAFLREFGGGDAGGEIIFGLSENPYENMVQATQQERAVGLPKSLVIIGFWNDTLICLDTGNMQAGECPVVELDETYNQTEIASSFGKFLYDYLSED